uniref:TATA-box-binding protein n=1 Tax=Mesocestoides corti TaxID=53468 RepID=A0A5K3EZ14_MESCO
MSEETSNDESVPPPLPLSRFVPSRPKVELLEGLSKPVIYNVVSSVDLGCPIELRKVVLQIRNAEYNPRRFTGCVIRLREPRVTCLLFSSGKLVTTGGRSEESNNLGARKCARVIQKLGFPLIAC